ncbi:tight adherence pilus pseudopilin TadF [Campylobacter sp. MG1]|uniref:tight adherence pilus pseudopilin TadF n=1 Tax=Campylobacter sp. MG1 TaxID=2976332 RepID=UPI00226D38F3|nr:tight adherence pilus pseudopilin TadF [Campylobacter sp. MG1]
MSSFLRNKVASVSIEVSFMLMFFVIFLVLSSDIGKLIKTQNSLEKISYSLAGIIRERTNLYNKTLLKESDIDNLYSIALVLNEKTLNKELGLVVESLEPNKNDDFNYKNYKRGEVECVNNSNLKDISKINFVNKFENYTSLYRVTLCTKNNDLFMPIRGINLKKLEPLASSVVYGR